MLKKKFRKILPITILISLFLGYFYLVVLGQNIFQYTDQELTLSYNGYLLNNYIAQEYSDHPAFFNILLNSLVNLFQINFYNLPGSIDLFNENILVNIEKLILSSRISNFILFSIFIFFLFSYIETKISNRFISALLTIFFISSYSVFIHTLQYRSEFLGVILVLVSFIFLENFLKDKKFKILYFILSIIFYYFSLLNKTQMIFYYPLYLSLFFCFVKIDRNEEISKKTLLLSLLIIPLNFFYYYKISGTASFFFSTFLYLSLNLIFIIFLFLNKLKIRSMLNILGFFNLFFVLVCFLLLQIVKHIGILSNSIFSNINNPLRMLVFTNKNISQMLSDNFFTYIFINISSNFLRFFNQFFMSIDNIINIFIYTFLIFLTSFKKKYKLLLIIIIGVLFQLLIGSITLNRYIQPQYLIYIDIITIFLFIFTISYLKIEFKNYIIIFFIILNISYIIVFYDFSVSKNHLEFLCESTFLRDFQTRLSYDNLKSDCLGLN